VRIPKPRPRPRPITGATLADARVGSREVFFEHHGSLQAAVYDGRRIEPGLTLSGPAIVQDPESSLVLPPGHRLNVDSYGNFVVDLKLETRA
jgi:N-methylhydantoinase A